MKFKPGYSSCSVTEGRAFCNNSVKNIINIKNRFLKLLVADIPRDQNSPVLACGVKLDNPFSSQMQVSNSVAREVGNRGETALPSFGRGSLVELMSMPNDGSPFEMIFYIRLPPSL